MLLKGAHCSLVWLTMFVGSAVADEQGAIAVDVSTCLAKPKQVIQLGSSVFGVLAEVFVDRADTVKRGQVVAKLNTTVEEAQVALDRHRAANTTQIESGKADLLWNQRELERRQKVANNMFATLNAVDEYVTKVEQDRIAIRRAEADQRTAALEAMRSESQLELKQIKSPVDGVVTELKLMPGEFIYETTPIMTIAQIDPLNVDLVVPSEGYKRVKVGMVAELHLYAPVDATYEATVDAIDPIIDAASDTFRVRLVLPNPGNAIPAGVRCSVRLPDIAASLRTNETPSQQVEGNTAESEQQGEYGKEQAPSQRRDGEAARELPSAQREQDPTAAEKPQAPAPAGLLAPPAIPVVQSEQRGENGEEQAPLPRPKANVVEVKKGATRPRPKQLGLPPAPDATNIPAVPVAH